MEHQGNGLFPFGEGPADATTWLAQLNQVANGRLSRLPNMRNRNISIQ